MIIDFHTHVFPPALAQNRRKYADSDPAFSLLYAQDTVHLATAEELVENMDREGVDISVIANYGWMTHELCVETNNYILEAIARYPDRLVGFCAVQPQYPDQALEEVVRCARAGARGIGELRPDLQLLDFPDTSLLFTLGDILRQYNMVLMMHTSEPVGHSYAGKGIVTPETFHSLLAALPEVSIVCSHWGGGLPFYALMPEVKSTLANVYFDSAASPFLYDAQVYRHVIGLVGVEHILFGTDYPLLPPSRLLAELENTDLTETEKELILSGNAKRLLQI